MIDSDKQTQEAVRKIATKKNKEILELKSQVYDLKRKVKYLQRKFDRNDYVYNLMHTTIEIACEHIPKDKLPAGNNYMNVPCFINKAKERLGQSK